MAVPDKLELTSMNITETQKEKLKELFPEVFTEGKIDFEKLKLTLGDDVDSSEERFGLTWAGKADCYKVIQEPSVGTLKPCQAESTNWDTTENLFIEGDNLEVLKQLQKAYYGKVKMIYIDPPYNTGNEFIYPDKYQENLDTYLSYTGQVDEEGKKFSTNTETTGRFHSNWLNMMYPRLFIARNLLKQDGLILISIDDNEYDNLKKICDEIFGEENRIESIIWKNKTGGGALTKGFIGLHEYILCYAKNSNYVKNLTVPYSEKTASMYNKKDEYYKERGPYATWPLDTTSMGDRPNLRFPIFHKGVEIWPKKQWLWSKERVLEAQKNNMLVFGKQNDGTFKVRFKGYLKDENGQIRRGKPLSLLEGPYTQEGSKDFEKFLSKSFFSFPKPVKLISQFLDLRTNDEESEKDAIILDFFSGSCSTAQAVLETNHQDGGSRKFIMVQLPEPTDKKSEAYKAGYKTITDIGKERIRRVIQNIQAERVEMQKQKVGELDFGQEEVTNNKQDLGFKVFKLDRSNFKIWDGDVEKKPIEEQLQLNIHRIDPNSSEEDLLYEILLKSGFQPTVPVTKISLAGKTVFSVAEDALLICIEKDLTKEIIKAVAEKQPIRAVFLDDGFKGNDQLKTNAVQIMKSHDVKEFKTV